MSEKNDTKLRLVVCINRRLGYGQKSCAAGGSLALIAKIKQLLKNQQLDVPVVEQVCLGKCEQGPAMRIAPGGRFYFDVDEETLPQIVSDIKALI